MANTLSIPERTLAQISASTNSINVVGGADGRTSIYEPLVCRITDHADNDAAETGTDTNKMALFTSARHGEPWKKDFGLTHLVVKAGADPVTANPTANTVTVLFPNFDYTTFE
tara:strand:- start:270 stop:608 length:339 start_codon:yes stop_codon:yes gene_type:complete